jgi:two-component system chemotaxis sensor kinase CheA
MDDAPRHEFLARAEELCDALYRDVQELRRADVLAPRQRRALVDRTFRHAHTLKGSASALPPLAPVTRLAHELENLLEAFRASRLAPDERALDACEDAAVALARTVEAAARETDAPDASETIARLRRFASEHNRAADQSEARHKPDSQAIELRAGDDSSLAELDALLSADERRRIAQVGTEGARLLLCEVTFDLSDFDEKFRQLTDTISGCCEIVSTLPAAQGTVPPSRIGFRLICAIAEPRELSPLAAQFGARLTELSTRNESISPTSSNDTNDGAISETTIGIARDDTANGGNANTLVGDRANSDEANRDGVNADESSLDDIAARKAVEGAPSSFVRVQLSELDDLIAAANELFDDAMRALDAARPPTFDAAANDATASVRRNLVGLVERVMALRMQPLARTLDRAARAARVAARRGGKRIEIEIEGGESRVDRAVAERLVAPLEHLLRNAVTHGIESPTERRKAGKDSRGRVRVEAVTEGSRVRVMVFDDGRGVDPERVAIVARAQELLTDDARLDEAQALRLIFRPGFSTAARITDEAGRGVGLDAVEREIESAGGVVRVRTRRGRGTTFELRLPRALALVPAVLVRAGRHAYAIDASRVVETFTRDAETGGHERSFADKEESRREEGRARGAIRWRDSLVPVVSLCALLGQDAARASSHVVIALADDAPARSLFDAGPTTQDDVGMRGDEPTDDSELVSDNEWAGDDGTGAGEQRTRLVAVEVDQLLGRREVLVRTLGRHATRWRGVAGAIDQRDGTVALMLDLPRLLEE